MKKMKTGGMTNPNKAAKASPTTGGKAVPYKKGGTVAKKSPTNLAGRGMMKKGGSVKKK